MKIEAFFIYFEDYVELLTVFQNSKIFVSLVQDF
jgi:hypothetical protein